MFQDDKPVERDSVYLGAGAPQLPEAGTNRRRQLPPIGSKSQASGQQPAEADMQSAKLTVAGPV
ncbi:hypothetical protein Cfor_11663 [Coptotermes formosanus]|uniref:Uncharacterized protein n=1 Tax=Coptotermes formosanus TaxID=36987 RepID=A0A6L2PGK8_COPFO|nr:hypothetical protein Cfor_11663 [Coptotermes formosanus]